MDKGNILTSDIEIIDIDGIYDVGLRSIGFNFRKNDLELVLNMIETISKFKGETNLMDSIIIEKTVPILVAELEAKKESST